MYLLPIIFRCIITIRRINPQTPIFCLTIQTNGFKNYLSIIKVNIITQFKKFSLLILIGGLTPGLSSYFISKTSAPVPQKKSTAAPHAKHKKPHPHGGPPGQTKKAHVHLGKKH